MDNITKEVFEELVFCCTSSTIEMVVWPPGVAVNLPSIWVDGKLRSNVQYPMYVSYDYDSTPKRQNGKMASERQKNDGTFRRKKIKNGGIAGSLLPRSTYHIYGCTPGIATYLPHLLHTAESIPTWTNCYRWSFCELFCGRFVSFFVGPIIATYDTQRNWYRWSFCELFVVVLWAFLLGHSEHRRIPETLPTPTPFIIDSGIST